MSPCWQQAAGGRGITRGHLRSCLPRSSGRPPAPLREGRTPSPGSSSSSHSHLIQSISGDHPGPPEARQGLAPHLAGSREAAELGRQASLALCPALSAIKAYRSGGGGGGGKTKMGKKTPPDWIGNKTGHCWVAGKALSAAGHHRPARPRAALLCAGGQRGCVRLCPLCSRGQGEVFGEGDLPSGLAALVQESELLFCQPVCPTGSP